MLGVEISGCGRCLALTGEAMRAYLEMERYGVKEEGLLFVRIIP